MTTSSKAYEPQTSVGGLEQSLLETAFFAATLAGRELIELRAGITTVESKSTENDWVSEADRASEQLISSRIRTTRPDDAQIGEEGTALEGTTGITWNFDPLDGTVNYLYGSDDWCVSIACADADGMLVGVVHEPVNGKTYWAVRGGGAFMNGRRLHVRPSQHLRQSLVATGYSYDPKLRVAQAAVVGDVLAQGRDIRRNGSAALSLCQVGSGEVDAYLESPINLWDISAASLVASEAGARVSIGDFRSALAVLVSAPGIHVELEELLASSESGRFLFPHLVMSA